MTKKCYIVPVFVPHLGCPHDCVFCNQRKIAAEMPPEPASIKEYARRQCGYFPSRAGNREIAFYGGSFTAIERERMEAYLSAAKELVEEGRVQGIRVSTRPDAVDDEVLRILEGYGVGTVELGIQSMDDEVLRRNSRGHDAESVRRASVALRGAGFSLGLQVMVGLPGATPKTERETAREVAELRPNFVRIYPTLVIRESPLEAMWAKGEYRPLSLEEGVERTFEMYKVFRRASIPVIRMGLQPTEEISEGGEAVAGPFHPAFRSLVESMLYRCAVEAKMERRGIRRAGRIVFRSRGRSLSFLAGYRGENRRRWAERYRCKEIRFYTEEVPEGIVKVTADGEEFVVDVDGYVRGEE